MRAYSRGLIYKDEFSDGGLCKGTYSEVGAYSRIYIKQWILGCAFNVP